MAKRWKEQDKRKIYEMREAGATFTQIALLMGRGAGAVCCIYCRYRKRLEVGPSYRVDKKERVPVPIGCEREQEKYYEEAKARDQKFQKALLLAGAPYGVNTKPCTLNPI